MKLLLKRFYCSGVALFLLAGPHAVSAQTANVLLHTFGDDSVANDGRNPHAALVLGRDGNFYGTTANETLAAGGTANDGTVYKITPAGTVTILHTFGDGTVANDGRNPQAALVLGNDGNFYGTTNNGGATGTGSASGGTAFRITPAGAVTILHSFGDGSVARDGKNPQAALVLGRDGNFYGTTIYGGSVGSGTVFRMTPAGTVTPLHSFADGTTPYDGSSPRGALVQGADGNFYGTAYSGGAAGGGTAFQITPAGAFTILHTFGDGTVADDGQNPDAGLALGRDGSLYGTTRNGGSAGKGTAFQMTPSGAMTLLHSFGDGSVAHDGTYPSAPLILGRDGSFYGTTFYGGSTVNGGSSNGGTVFRMTPGGTVTLLHSFLDQSSPQLGVGPDTALLQGSDEGLYGTTFYGGSKGFGTVFKVMLPTAPVYTQIVWNHTSDGQVSLWSVASDFTFTQHSYGPYSGWTARAVSDGPDGVAHLLWTNTNGTATVWNIAANGSFTQHVFGPYAGWKAVSLSTSPNGSSHLLWDNTNGTASLWTLNTSAGTFTQVSYGPYTGWTANAVADGPNVTDLLWNNVNGAAFGWRLSASGLVNKSFGPYSGWNAQALSVGPDDGAHLLWDNTSGQVALWSVDFATGGFTQGGYGPFSGWTAKAIATGPDNVTHLLWNHPSNGQVSLWNVSGSGAVNHEFGPYAGWTATALSAGL